MTFPSSNHPSRSRSPLALVLGSCAVIGLCVIPACVLLALTANAAYWMNRYPMAGVSQGPSVSVTPTNFETLPAGNADPGEQVFTSAGCSACHSLDPGEKIIGPSLSGISTRAGTTKADYSAEKYIFESISDPNAYLVEGFQGDMMPANFNGRLSAQQLADLVAFLMTR
jgi:cytochrome c2